MAKMVKVESCWECQYRARHRNRGGIYSFYCKNIMPQEKIEDSHAIPSWCPLPDYPEEGKDE